MKKRTFMAALATGAGLFESCAKAIAEQKEALQLEIALPFHGKERTVFFSAKQPQLHVLVRNVSSSPEMIFRDWCSWGYYALSFAGTDSSGKALAIKKQPREWTKNYPDFWTVAPGETLVIPVNMGDRDTWQGFPDPPADDIHFVSCNLKAIFEIKEQFLQDRPHWTGRVESKPIDITIRR